MTSTENIEKIRLFGLSASGTCFVHWLLEQNFYVEVLQEGIHDKHQKYSVSPVHGVLPCFIVIKRLPAWVVSIRRYRKKRKSKHMTCRQLCQWWVKQNSHWLKECPKFNTHWVYYDAVLNNPEVLYTILHDNFKRRKHSMFTPANKMRPIHGAKQSDKPFDPDYYLKHEYLKELTPADLEVIAEYEDSIP